MSRIKKMFWLPVLVAAVSASFLAPTASAYSIYGSGQKWGDSGVLGTPGGMVSWSIVPGAWTALMPVNMESEIARAFQSWSDAINGRITFREVTDDGRPPGPGDNLVNGQNGDNAGDIRFWGANSTSWIGISYGPKNYWGANWMGDVMFNTDYFPWADIYYIALHEIGHSLGLGHSADGGAVMYSGYWGQTFGPQTDDIKGLGAVYGLPEPSTVFMFLTGGVLIWVYRRRSAA